MQTTQKNILLVDDSRVVLSMVKKAIFNCSEINSELVTAESYAQTKELISKHKFHVAILDVTLPDAPNGEVIDLLLAQGVPVIVLTGGINQASKSIILEKDIVEYITKSNPQSLNYIVTSVKRVLHNYDSYVLVVDDSKFTRAQTSKNLKKLHVNVIEASSAKEAIDILYNSKYYIPLVITDYEMPEMNGMELTMELRQSYSKDRLSIIALSGSENSKIATEFLRHGANDFIKKGYTDEEFAVRINVNLELVDLFRQGKDTASKDYLTGLYNRRFFFESGVPLLQKVKRKKLPLAVAMLDIDFFKKINDTYGHDVGDIAIKEVAVILHKYLRISDLISRFGGEEFCILMDDMDINDIYDKFEHIRTSFENNIIEIKDLRISYTVSIGIYYGYSSTLEEMVSLSDKALYEAKGSGRNKVVLHTDS
ncbi:diguanylate cyclase [Sulfurimonas sp. SAG-AH-194-C21]|nr:diguanylate cyclase [Sulfurimonas sp. SAG-AH-194-C21]MDF1884051.1 diguanylate cyclase [Sulfurimonas sp. SAG-AH-194-C21]